MLISHVDATKDGTCPPVMTTSGELVEYLELQRPLR